MELEYLRVLAKAKGRLGVANRPGPRGSVTGGSEEHLLPFPRRPSVLGGGRSRGWVDRMTGGKDSSGESGIGRTKSLLRA
jgi:hypothetical protein